MSSLLAHLYSKIKGSPEDVATLSLCYILENSRVARQAFSKYLASVSHAGYGSELSFRTQVAGENSERPDLVGFDSSNNEVFLIEAKFWAGLTPNQPLAYLSRLRNNGDAGKALIFICPKDRIVSLWGELLRLCSVTVEHFADEAREARRTQVEGVSMAIVSWRSVLGILMQALAAEHSPLMADLQQLHGLCETMDKNAFVPFLPEDFGVDKARRIISYYNIVDRVADDLVNSGLSSRGLRATPQYAGYRRYLRSDRLGMSVGFDCQLWAAHTETPFLLSLKEVRDGRWVYAQHAHEKLRAYEDSIPKKLFFNDRQEELLLPLYAPVHACESDVVTHLAQSVKRILHEVDPGCIS